MDHNAYEKEMIDGVNRNADERVQYADAHKSTDAKTLWRGFKRMLLAIITATMFALSVYCFIATATVTGYWAVALFLSAIVLMFFAFTLLYAQGITYTEGEGDE